MENEPKLIIVIRKDLNLRKGKWMAQGGHASLAWLINSYDCLISPTPTVEQEWLYGRQKKIVLQTGSLEELLSLKIQCDVMNVRCHTVIDAGLTELPGPTMTCIAIGPDYNEKIDPITGHLQLF
jgi:peptidyl-tRNA hydrolase, PTH2 family